MVERIEVADLTAAIGERESAGYRLDTIMPADDPTQAWLSGGPDGAIELFVPVNPAHSDERGSGTNLVVRRSDEGESGDGRAGMVYRDLVPGRFGGTVIASHISIADGGPTADYPHHHEIDFQVIVCVAGWVDVVYEDQGPPFRMLRGDCVVQPPTIGHRVLASSAGLSVFEVASPAMHPTHRRHDLILPTGTVDPERDFGGQRFARHISAESPWISSSEGTSERQPTGIGEATRFAGDVEFVRISQGVSVPMTTLENAATAVTFVLEGVVEVTVDDQTCELSAGDSVATTSALAARVRGASAKSEVVVVAIS